MSAAGTKPSRISAKPVLVALFLFCAVPAGMLMALLTPPGQVPDEQNHMARISGLLHGFIVVIHHVQTAPGAPPVILPPAVDVDAGLYLASWGHVSLAGNRPVVTANDLAMMRNQPAFHASLGVAIPNTASYFPAAYLPAALGVAVGLWFNASPYHSIMIARFCMLAAFLLCGALAIWIADFGAAWLLAILLLPMTLFLAGSLNEDGVLIGMACLAAAALAKGGGAFSAWRVTGLVLLVLILGSKPPYMPLLGLCLLPLFAPGRRRRLIEMMLAALPALLWLAFVSRYTVVPFGKPPYHPGPLWLGDPSILLDHTDAAMNLRILLAHPSRFITLPLQSTIMNGWQKLREMIGVLGVLQIGFSDFYYRLWGYALAVALLGLVAVRRGSWAALLAAAYVVLLFGLAYWAIMISMYLNWTAAGADSIDGFQGRYFILLLPFVLVAFSGLRGEQTRAALLPALPAIFMGLYDVIFLPLKLIEFYYVH